MTTTVNGTLRFDDPRGEPIHHLRVALRGQNTAGLQADLAFADTDLAGAFSFDNVEGEPSQLVGFECHRTYNEGGKPIDTYAEAFVLDLTQSGAANLVVPFWLYRDGAPVPRAGINASGKTDQQHAPGYNRALQSAVAQIAPIAGVLGKRITEGDVPTLSEVQAAYPESFTARMDRFADHSKSDAWLGEMVLNGFNTNLLLREKSSGRIAMDIRWSAPSSDGVHDSSNVTALFELREDKLFPVEIRLDTLSPATQSEWQPAVNLTQHPGGEHWEYAKRALRCQYLLAGALEAHIIKTHLVVEQYCIAAYRNLRKSPLRHLLMPQLQEVIVADTDADDFAWGPKGQIPMGSVIKFPDVELSMTRLLGQMDWAGWQPRAPICGGSKYAILLNAWWELMGTYVDEFIETHRDELQSEWEELSRFSADLHHHSPPRVAQHAPPGFDFVCANEVTQGVGDRSISPVITSDQPNDADIQRLKAMCQYLLTLATFIHTWVHQGQYDVGGDMSFASLALSGGDGSLESKGPSVSEAIQGLLVNSNGRQVNFGFLVENEAGDVPPGLGKLLRENAEKFRAMGFDVASVRSRINI
jgi:hypothetical protein